MLNEVLQQRLNERKHLSLHRTRHIIERHDQNDIEVKGQRCVDFSNNDYLSLRKHPKITEALTHAIKKYGLGSSASPLISGYSTAHAETENNFAEWLGVDKAILFTSGYCANLSIINALTSRCDTVFSDKLCHASLIDGITLSRTKHIRYQHNNIAHLEMLAQKTAPRLIITESIFSMEGDIAPIPNIVNLAKRYHSGLLIDDAHGIGILGKTGKGVLEHFNVQQHEYTCLVLPLGKAFNAMGAIVVGKSDVIEAILQFGRSYSYSTALPPAICVAIQTALLIIKEERWRQEKLKENIQFFIQYAAEKKLDLISIDKTPIQSILVPTNEKALALQNFLLPKGFYVSAIRPPTVPKNKTRLRISLNSFHTQDQITRIIDHIATGLKIAS